MAISTSLTASTGSSRLLQRLPQMLWVVAALVAGLAAEQALSAMLDPPGRALRRELQAAAGELQKPLVAQPTAALRHALRRHFHEAGVDVDTTRFWPDVVVSLRGMTQEECIAALHEARRIDGPVVVALEGYRSAEDCRERNYMTWRLMP